MPEIEFDAPSPPALAWEECPDCIRVKCLSPEAAEAVMKSCEGPKIMRVGCEDVTVCGSDSKYLENPHTEF